MSSNLGVYRLLGFGARLGLRTELGFILFSEPSASLLPASLTTSEGADVVIERCSAEAA